MRRPTTRAERRMILMDPRLLDRFTTEEAMWYESPEQRDLRMERMFCRDVLIGWVRDHLPALSEAQRISIELHYFAGLTYEEAARRLGKNKSTMKRNDNRGIETLRALKLRDDSWKVYADLYRNGPLRARVSMRVAGAQVKRFPGVTTTAD